jgi:4-hydroxy-3-methylbut-2-enyl diphosphate reductase
LPSPRGYCAGVNRAIEILDKVLKQYKKWIYVNHEIIHNKFIINYYEKKWIIFWEDLDKIPEGSFIIFSAHWVWPEFIKKVKEKKLKYIDASCPLVIKVHIEARKFLDAWYEIIYIWKEWHQEAEWVKEEWKDRIYIIQNEKELDNLKLSSFSIKGSTEGDGLWKVIPLALLTQTTLSTIETKSLIEKVKEKFPEIVLPKAEDICYATTNRQNSVLKICKENIDLLIIIGSKNSSNSSKLKEIWEKLNIKSLLIDSYKEIDINVLEKIYSEKQNVRIWISSWASAPEHLVQEVLEFFKNIWKTEIKEIKTVEEKMVFPSNIELK